MKSPSPLPADLPTAPIGRQQIIDIKAGAILRHNRKHRRLFGCPLTPLLTAIVFFKALVFSIWLYREFNTFDFRCAIVSPILEESEQLHIRKKRFSIDFDDFENLPPRVMTLENADESDDPDIIEQRERAKKKRPLFGGGFKKINDDEEEEEDESNERKHTPATTIVTLTNTQIVPIADGKQGTIRMKTIRNRIENVGGEDEEFVEIDIGSAPRVYVSKIRSRHDESPLLTTRSAPDENVDGEKKKKGKGRKKDKNKKGLGRKKNKNLENNQIGEDFEPTTQAPTQSTKGPRHLFSPPQDVFDPDATTTSRPHRSDFLGGVIDPLDENFTNQGEIRGYPMQKASKKPKGGRKKNKNKTDSGIRLSEEIKMMWDLNELNYTTLTMPKTTEMTQPKANGTKAQPSNPTLTSLDDKTNTNHSKNDGGRKKPDENDWWKDSKESEDEDEWPMDGSVEIENKVDRNGNGQFEPEKEVEVEYGHPYRPEILESPGHRSVGMNIF
ncbi:hypothetical protein WR25_19095 [Diploscapter pachys]|uniref:Uncharacterized protein n=1 Tax=Diploscapter pachys TaxID=2018661 RepID=A0A2A2LNH7_9BILA|nr:hypothetical protein WR25_19095 [Diploscapter pachys]